MPKDPKKAGAVTKPVQQTPAEYDWSQSECSGFENVQKEDLGIPFLSIIQKGSPQFDKDSPEYPAKKIAGCDVGDIFNTVSNLVVASAGEPLEFIPCSFQKMFVEWTPRDKGGGIVRTHSSAVVLDECVRNERGQDVLKNGNIVVTTAYFYGIALIDGEKTPAIIGLTSTQLKKSRSWLNMMMGIKSTRPDGMKYTPPMFSHKYLLSTQPEKNEKGSWRGWLIQLGDPVTDPVLIADSIGYAKRAGTIQKAALSAPKHDTDEEV